METKSKLQKKLSSYAFSLRLARRYLFSKKSHNAINIISAISATGVGIGTMVLICVLSVFNGFESLIAKMFSDFDPDLQITLNEGKSFDVNCPEILKAKKSARIANFCDVVQDNALLRFKEKQMSAIVKGVDTNFVKTSNIKHIMYDGDFILYDGAFERIVMGVGVANTLSAGARFVSPVVLYAPKRQNNINIAMPENSFIKTPAFISGLFQVKQQQYDDNLTLVSINLARQLFDYNDHTVTAIELKLKNPAELEKAQKEIESLVGDKYKVKNRYQQQESFFKIMEIEKWITYLILSFILLIATFNIVGSLSMLIIDKKDDIITLRNLGASNQMIKNIFLFEGWLISALGAILGIIFGNILCLAQENFEILKLGNEYIVNAYPVKTNWTDSLAILATVLFMGLLAAFYPIKHIKTKIDN